MNLYTSYFAKVKQLKEMGLKLVCVAGYAPKFFYDTPDVFFYPDLAPRKDWFWEWKGGASVVRRGGAEALRSTAPPWLLLGLGTGQV